MSKIPDLFPDLFNEATEDWTESEREAFRKRIVPKVRANPEVWFDARGAQKRRELMIGWLNKEAARYMSASARLQGVGDRFPYNH